MGPAEEALTLATWSFYGIAGKIIEHGDVSALVWETEGSSRLKDLTSVFAGAAEATEVMKPEERQSRA